MEEATPKVSIIIPHYNQKECLKVLLPSIANQTFDDYEVIIIDDFTPDRSAPVYIRSLIKDYSKMRLVENAENMRFVRTCNKGIKLAKGDYICLLNQDTEVVNNFVQRNVEIMDADPLIGALSCIVVDGNGNNWFTGGRFESGFMVNLVDDFEGIRTVDFVAGTACFYRREVLDKIGLFDETFLMYHEDVEFGLRMKAKTNYKACMFAERLVVHYSLPSMSQGNLYFYLVRNQFILAKRYGKKYIPKILLYNLRQIRKLLLASVVSLIFSLYMSLYIVRGILAGLMKRQ